ncbi:cytochrome b5 [Gonapodya prolifera JEL478]|uniref:Cytochrome b5 n=1 Tax=Gonapodya prolifera (strain JEL478) TaxID=1344416 RepID=A0A139ARW3_GONPJ|nr:cytochrome b5 [Gonapodya prolifera JEL478]|eukprot:KXS19459.1 cytochrome b5 [Gonapodya prolifera JEL478]
MELYSWKDIVTHSKPTDLWIVINNSVYNVTKYLADHEHPGGDEVLEDQGGQDATEAFEEIGHSDDALKTLATYKIGTVKDPDQKPVKKDPFAIGKGKESEKKE